MNKSAQKPIEKNLDNVNILDFEMFDPVKAGEPWAADYGHVSPDSLYSDLTWALDGFDDKSGVYLFCCADCGKKGCWSVTFQVKQDEQYVYWYDFKHEHRPWEYNLKYKFEKQSYELELQKLRNMTFNQRLAKS